MFYWFFEPRSGDAGAPLILWLQGGPGASGIEDGLLRINGPYAVEAGKLVPRRITWNEDFAMLYVDSPIGTGFSSASNNGSYASDQAQVAAMLLAALDQFYEKKLWPRANPLVVAGESYGGHYCPVLGTTILAANAARGAAWQVPLAGVAIGDGLTDPQAQVVTKPAQAFAFGLVDEATRDAAQREADEAARLCAAGAFEEALGHRNAMEHLVLGASGINAYDVRTFHQYDDGGVVEWLNSSATRRRLGVVPHFFGTDPGVKRALLGDIMRSYKDHVLTLLDAKLPLGVLLYQGQFDWKDGATSNAAWIASLGLAGFAASPRAILRDARTGNAYGWVKNPAGPLVDVVLGSAGHMAPMDQPEAALDMITRFIRATFSSIMMRRITNPATV